MVIFHCYVSSPEGKSIPDPPAVLLPSSRDERQGRQRACRDLDQALGDDPLGGIIHIHSVIVFSTIEMG
jgi:hypothetical protein